MIVDLALRRYGYGVIHAARVPPQLVYSAMTFGTPCEAVPAPIVTRCGVTLRSVAVVMHSPVDCRACKAITDAEHPAEKIDAS
jgi:hypothetical protein